MRGVDGVIVKSNFLRSKLGFAGLDLDTGLGTGYDDDFKQNVKLVQELRSGGEVIAVRGIPVSDRVTEALLGGRRGL